jgi:hypothetical protein
VHQARWKSIATNRAQHLRRETVLVLAEHVEDGGHPADAVRDLGEQFRSCPGAETAQVFGAALESDTIEGCEAAGHGDVAAEGLSKAALSAKPGLHLPV